MTLHDEVARYLQFVEGVREHDPDFLRFATGKDREREAARQILCKWRTRHLDGMVTEDVYWTTTGGELVDDGIEGLTDTEARRIAGDWHGGQSSPLYAFCSLGTMIPGLNSEIDYCLDRVTIGKSRDELLNLKAYVMSVANFNEDEDDGA